MVTHAANSQTNGNNSETVQESKRERERDTLFAVKLISTHSC